jgi:hypothetical protein
MTAGPRPDLTGQILDRRFRVERLLGRGGMGAVWRVQHVESLQALALKTIDPALAATPEALERFLREARAAGALRSRHVTRIVDAQTGYVHDGAPLPFLVMELLEGRTLQELLDAEGRLAAGQLAWVAAQLGRALSAAHERGIVHRDLKPSNVFIAHDSEDDGQPIVKLCDFGIAKLLGDAPALGSEAGLLTQTGALLGTPMYLAPELLRGAGGATPATDQWSLGLLAFRALAGIEYFGHVRGIPALVLAIATERMPPPSELAPHARFSAAFDGWFLRSCARAPGDRFPDVAAQVAALAAALGHPPAEALALDDERARPARERARPAHDHAAATGPTVAATAARATSAPAGAPRRARRMVYVAGATLWAIFALAWIATRPGARDGQNDGQSGGQSPPALPAAAAPLTAPPPIERTATVSPPAPAAAAARVPTTVEARPANHEWAIQRATGAASPQAKKRPRPPRGLGKGESCRRSSDCASGLCAAETCQ